MESKTGSAEFTNKINVFLRNFDKIEKDITKFPTISTQRSDYAPSLACYLIKNDQMDFRDNKFLYCCKLSDILFDIKKGNISTSGELKSAIFKKIKKTKLCKYNSQIFFDLLYAGLQFYAYFKIIDYKEMFLLCADLIYSIKTAKVNYEAHVDHFMVHAAAFISSNSPNQKWEILQKEIVDNLEDWGFPAPDRNIIIHAAHNLNLCCEGIPEEDFTYELIKELRSRYYKKEIQEEEVFDTLNRKVGWKTASEILKILWRDVYKSYYEYNKGLTNKFIKENDILGAINLSKKINFVSKSNIPYIKNFVPSGEENKCTLSFPGGKTIGYTSTLCKVGKTRILIDYGSNPFGRTPVWSPEIDMIDSILITHAHQDHIGGLFKLYKEGYRGPWYASMKTKPLVRLALNDSRKLNKDNKELRSLYSKEQIQLIMEKFKPIFKGTELNINENISVKAFPAGHIHGSYQYLVKTPETNIFFTGDFNTKQSSSSEPIQIPEENERKKISALVVEGTYAFREESILDNESAKNELLKEISLCDKFPILIPVLSLGRAQEVLKALSGTEYCVGIFGLARKMTLACKMKFENNIITDFNSPYKVRKNDFDIIVASAGCLQGGPSRFFFNHPDWGQPPTILTGYLFPGTPARDITEELPLIRYSAHAPHKSWSKYIKSFPNADIFLIHYPQSRKKAEKMNIIVPYIHREYTVRPV